MNDDVDAYWLGEALTLAELCPPSDTAFAVGAIIVDTAGNEIARGYSRETDPTVHAEEAALEKAARDPRLHGATIYSTLEPCGERKSRPRTCSDLIIGAGIGRVVFLLREPATFVAMPNGMNMLRSAGVEVVEHPGPG